MFLSCTTSIHVDFRPRNAVKHPMKLRKIVVPFPSRVHHLLFLNISLQTVPYISIHPFTHIHLSFPKEINCCCLKKRGGLNGSHPLYSRSNRQYTLNVWFVLNKSLRSKLSHETNMAFGSSQWVHLYWPLTTVSDSIMFEMQVMSTIFWRRRVNSSEERKCHYRHFNKLTESLQLLDYGLKIPVWKMRSDSFGQRLNENMNLKRKWRRLHRRFVLSSQSRVRHKKLKD